METALTQCGRSIQCRQRCPTRHINPADALPVTSVNTLIPDACGHHLMSFPGDASSSSKMRWAGPSRSSYCPLRTDHQKATPTSSTIMTDRGISKNRMSIRDIGRSNCQTPAQLVRACFACTLQDSTRWYRRSITAPVVTHSERPATNLQTFQSRPSTA